MTSEQINILVKDGDIWPESSSKYRHTPQAYFTNYDNNETYVVSDELFDILNHIFKDKIRFEVDFEHDLFKTLVTNKMGLISPSKEHKIIFYNTLIQDQNKQLSDIIQGNYYNTVQELISRTFALLFFENGMEWIECLKFQILKGENLDTLNLRDPNLKYLRDFFLTVSMNELYKIATVQKNINYIQKNIIDLDKPNIGAPTHRDRGIARIYKEYAYSDKYPKLLREDAKKEGKNFEIALNDLGYWGKTKSKTARPAAVEDLRRVIKYDLLSKFPNALNLLNNDIYNLESK